MRQTINIAVSKAMEDMKGNMGRSIRNLLDLGLLFSKSETQKWFFTAARKVAANPKSPYNALVKRILSDIDNDTIKKVEFGVQQPDLWSQKAEEKAKGAGVFASMVSHF